MSENIQQIILVIKYIAGYGIIAGIFVIFGEEDVAGCADIYGDKYEKDEIIFSVEHSSNKINKLIKPHRADSHGQPKQCPKRHSKYFCKIHNITSTCIYFNIEI